MAIYDVSGNPLNPFTELEMRANALGMRYVPDSVGKLNVVKRARQLTDIKWTPAADIPRISRFDNDADENTGVFEDVFRTGVEYTGIPYTSAKGTNVSRYGYTRLTVGSFIGIDTFATSVANADSFLCKESTYDSSISLAGMYGSTCCGLVSYAIDIPWTSTENFGTLITNGTLVSKGLASDINNFDVADVLVDTTTHVALITDIIKDEDGNIEFIEVSENTTHGAYNPSVEGSQYGGHARRMGWALADFVDFFGGYTVCSYRDVDSVDYTPSEFVNVGDTFDRFISPDYPCLPYMGENFAYKAGYIYNSDILIASEYFSELDVYKDGTLLNTYPITSGMKKITVGFSATGEYEAFLCNRTNGTITAQSKSCHWSVIA